MKKLITLMLAIIMVTGVLAGCTQPAPSSSTPEPTEPAEVMGVAVAEGGRLEKVLAEGKITMVISPKYAPYEFIDLTKINGGQEKYVGADIDLAYYIAEKLGVELVIEEMDFSGVLAAMSESKADMAISGLSAKEERKTSMDFSQPYDTAETNLIVVQKGNEDKFKTIDDTNNADNKFAVLIGSTQQTLMEKLMPNVTPQMLATPADGIAELRSGKLDGIVCSNVTAKGFVARYDDLALAPVELGNDAGGLCAAFPKGNEDLVEVVNKIIDEVMAEGLFGQWLSAAEELSASQQSLQGE